MLLNFTYFFNISDRNNSILFNVGYVCPCICAVNMSNTWSSSTKSSNNSSSSSDRMYEYSLLFSKQRRTMSENIQVHSSQSQSLLYEKTYFVNHSPLFFKCDLNIFEVLPQRVELLFDNPEKVFLFCGHSASLSSSANSKRSSSSKIRSMIKTCNL